MEHLHIQHDMLVSFRKELHRHPELSGQEADTAARVVSFLQSYNADEIITGLGGNGVAAVFKGKTSGKSILFRCELDALPIVETNDFEHRSISLNVSHKCGHDGHMAILCGLAAKISSNLPTAGKVILLFQPAEEDGTGAREVYEEPRLKQLQPDFVFALHNLPGYPKKQVVVRKGTFSAAVCSMIIKLDGKTAHAGEPHNGINPAVSIAEIIETFNTFIRPDIAHEDFCLITPIYINMGEKAYGVSAGSGEIHFTIRSNSNQQMDSISRMLQTEVAKIASRHHLGVDINWIQPFRANENTDEAVDMIVAAANKVQLNVFDKPQPFSWGEDFGLLTEHYTGAMFGLGAGIDTPALHNPDYDYPDDITQAGIDIFYQILQDLDHAQ